MARYCGHTFVAICLLIALLSAIAWYRERDRSHPRYLVRWERVGNSARQLGCAINMCAGRLVIDWRDARQQLSEESEIPLAEIQMFPGAVEPVPAGRWHWLNDRILWSSGPDVGLPRGPLARLGFRWRSTRYDWDSPIAGSTLSHRESYRVVAVPFWFLVSLFSTLAVVWTWREVCKRRIQRSMRRGYCPVCNYDLRATPDRRPECGRTLDAP